MSDDEPQPGAPRSRNLLRDLSDQAVLEAIFRKGEITRPELSALTGLSKPTVSEAVRRLVKQRLIRSAGARSGNLGRSPLSYVVDDAAGYVIGVDVGGTNIRVAAVNLFGEFVGSRREVQHQGSRRSLADQVHAVVREVVRSTQATHSQLLAVAASVTGVQHQPTYGVDGDAGTDDPLSVVRDRIGVPVLADSSINMSAVGEKWRGLATGVSDFVFVSIGAVAGAAIVVSDELVRGAHLSAGDISGLPGPPGPASGRRGAPAGHGIMDATALLDRARTLRWKAGPPETIAEIFDRAGSEPAAKRLIDAEAAQVAFAVETVCAILDPDLVVLGGGIGSFAELLAPVRARTAATLTHPVRIESSLLGDQAALHGALAVALRDAHEQLFRRDARPLPMTQATRARALPAPT